MFQIDREVDQPVLVIKLSGLMHSGDFLDQMPEIKEYVAATQLRVLLLDWTDLTGWDEAAESVRFYARLELRENFTHIAVLADEQWEAEVGRLEDVTRLAVSRFSPTHREDAMAWLTS